MSALDTPAARRVQIGLTILRVIAGITFLAHGWQKVFTYGFAGVSGSFGQMGIPMPGVMGPFIALLELLGGIALIVGLLTRLAAFGLMCDMLGAILFVHAKHGFFAGGNPPGGYEFVLALATMAATLAFAGPGTLAIDDLIARRRGAAPVV